MIRFSLGGVLFTILVVISVVNAKFPTDPQPCKFGDSECIKKLIDYFMSEMNQGDSSINLVKVEPLNVAKISIQQGAESPVNINLTFTNTDIVGMSNSKTTKVKGFGKDLTQKHELVMKFRNVTMLSDYSINGRVLILPISGMGKSNITMVNADMFMRFVGAPYEKNGKTYMKIQNMKLNVIPERIWYNFGNLFNGDKALGDNMNLFLNENWSDIYNEVRASITSAYARIFESVINNVFTKYPYEEFFEE